MFKNILQFQIFSTYPTETKSPAGKKQKLNNTSSIKVENLITWPQHTVLPRYAATIAKLGAAG